MMVRSSETRSQARAEDSWHRMRFDRYRPAEPHIGPRNTPGLFSPVREGKLRRPRFQGSDGNTMRSYNSRSRQGSLYRLYHDFGNARTAYTPIRVRTLPRGSPSLTKGNVAGTSSWRLAILTACPVALLSILSIISARLKTLRCRAPPRRTAAMILDGPADEIQLKCALLHDPDAVRRRDAHTASRQPGRPGKDLLTGAPGNLPLSTVRPMQEMRTLVRRCVGAASLSIHGKRLGGRLGCVGVDALHWQFISRTSKKYCARLGKGTHQSVVGRSRVSRSWRIASPIHLVPLRPDPRHHAPPVRTGEQPGV